MSGALDDLSPHHVGLSVRDLDESIKFWTEVFGFKLDFQTEIPPIKARVAFVKRGDFRMELFEIEGSTDTPEERQAPNTDLKTQGCKHFCFCVNDVQAALESLHTRGVPIVGIARSPGAPMVREDDPRLDEDKTPATAFFFLDPSGVMFEILGRGDFSD